MRERDALRGQLATADQHIEAAVAFERASHRDDAAAAAEEADGRTEEARLEGRREG